MSRRIARRRQQSRNQTRRKWTGLGIRPMRGSLKDAFADCIFTGAGTYEAPPVRVVLADPETFDWHRGFGAPPVFRRMDGSAIGPMLLEYKEVGGTVITRWETVEVRPK